MVETPNEGRGPPQKIKASAALTRMDGLAQRPTLEKIRLLDVNRRAGARALCLGGVPALASIQPHGSNLVGQPHFHHVPRFTPFHQTQNALGDEAPHSLPRRPDRKSTRLNSSHLVISYAVFCF